MKYKTIENEVVVKNVIKRSIFIGTVKKVSHKKEAEEFIKSVRENYKDANHNPYAFRLLSGEFYYSDDGEPSGSSGLPIFNSIRHFDIYNVCVVVTRYFGGIKLGIPGLIEAYGGTASFAIRSANIIEQKTVKIIEIKFPYASFNYVNYALSKIPNKIINRDFKDTGTITVEIEEDLIENFKALLEKDKRIGFSVLDF